MRPKLCAGQTTPCPYSIFLTYMKLRNAGGSMCPSHHYFPAEHASPPLSPEHYNHQKLVFLKKKKRIFETCPAEQRSLCASRSTTSLRLANCAVQQLACRVEAGRVERGWFGCNVFLVLQRKMSRGLLWFFHVC